MFQPHYPCMEYIRNSWAVHLYAQNLASEQKKKKKERERRGIVSNILIVGNNKETH